MKTTFLAMMTVLTAIPTLSYACYAPECGCPIPDPNKCRGRTDLAVEISKLFRKPELRAAATQNRFPIGHWEAESPKVPARGPAESGKPSL